MLHETSFNATIIIIGRLQRSRPQVVSRNFDGPPLGSSYPPRPPAVSAHCSGSWFSAGLGAFFHVVECKGRISYVARPLPFWASVLENAWLCPWEAVYLSEVMLIGTRQQLSKVNLDTLTVGDTSAAIVNKARNLGVWFDSQLNFNVHRYENM